jgi:hypothetical protein
MSNNFLITWDETNKKWVAIEDGGAPYDLVERPTVEQAMFNVFTPGAADGLLWRDTDGDFHIHLGAGDILYLNRGLTVVEPAFFDDDITMVNTKQINGLRDLYGGALIDSNGLAAITVYAGEFQWNGTVLKAYAKRLGGTGATVNIQVGGLDIRAGDLSLAGTAWTDFGALQNTGITDGEDCDFQIATTTGVVTQIAFLLEVERA